MSGNNIERNGVEDFSVTLQHGVKARFSRQENTSDYEVKSENVPVSPREQRHDATIGRTQLAVPNHKMEQSDPRLLEPINGDSHSETTREKLIESTIQDT